jgi:uncharacterized protein YdeI (YjbR/CyaY-like superfamily)
MGSHDSKPVLAFDTVAEWETWLADHPDSDGVRLRLRKKGSPRTGLMYPDALDGALCFGWIDGQVASLDEDFYLQVFTPRRRASVWSQRNRDYVERLTGSGRMQPAGLAEVERAKADGRWEAAYRQGTAEVPADLRSALDASPTAAALFAELNAQNRFAIIFRVEHVKRASARAAKIAGFVAMLERGETIYPHNRGPRRS